MKRFHLLFALFGLAIVGRAQEVVIVANPTVTESSLSADDLKNILLNNKTKWSSGPVIKLVVLSAGTAHEKVIKDFTQRTPDQFDKYWKKQVFTGAGVMPAEAKSDSDVIAYVAANPGAIGYVSAGADTSAVKVIQIN